MIGQTKIPSSIRKMCEETSARGHGSAYIPTRVENPTSFSPQPGLERNITYPGGMHYLRRIITA